MISGLNRQVFTQISYGLYIVTSHLNGRLNGQIVNTVLQVTSEPPRVAVIINKNNAQCLACETVTTLDELEMEEAEAPES